jgi:hypothetical protein
VGALGWCPCQIAQQGKHKERWVLLVSVHIAQKRIKNIFDFSDTYRPDLQDDTNKEV